MQSREPRRQQGAALLAGGVTRLSVGVPSLRPQVLELFGRAHAAEEGLRAFEAARAGGTRRPSADLIDAAPGLTAEQCEADLARVLDVAGGLEHVPIESGAVPFGVTERGQPLADAVARDFLVPDP